MDLLDLHNLTQEERNIILSVIRRDDELRRRQENRISQVKQEIHNLRMNSVLRSGDDLTKMCARCKGPFGFISNTGEVCPVCRFRVCKNCRETLLSTGWLCVLCFKENQLQWLSGEWMGATSPSHRKSHYNNGTDLLRASLRVRQPNGTLGGDGAAGNNGNRRSSSGQNNPYPPHSPDKNSLSNLFHSLRSGLGGGADDQEAPLVGAVGGGEGEVQHVSCRRRRDSNSSNSDSDLRADKMSTSKKRFSETNGMPASRLNGTRKDREGAARNGDGQSDPRVNSLPSSEASGNTIKDSGKGGDGKTLTNNQPRKSELPRAVHSKDNAQKRHADGKRGVHHDTVNGSRPSSSCSFTSSEWGEITPTEASRSFPAQERKEDVGSPLSQSSRNVSTSKTSLLDMLEGGGNPSVSLKASRDEASSARSKPSPSKLPVMVRRESRDSCTSDSPRTKSHPAGVPPDPQPPSRLTKKEGNVQTHVRRQSSGRSETFSTCSGKTASPATKMRLLDLASSRALERDGDSVKSWSEGSEDTISLGMSCSGLPASADTPVFQKMRRPKAAVVVTKAKDASPRNSNPRLSDGEHTGPSDQSDTGAGSPAPAPRPLGSNPTLHGQKSSLSIPSVTATSTTGSNGERSMDEDEDDDNLDELFAKYRSRSQLGISRSTIGDSRESLASVYSDAGEINYGRIPVQGQISFGLDYDHKLSALRINIKSCQDLAPVDTKHNRSDPYVKVYLLPDKTRSGKQKSKIKRHTLNPVFNETLTYHISRGELENRTLSVTVWHNDRFGRNDFLGEVTIPMDTYRFDDPTPCSYSLEARMPESVTEESMQYKGDLTVALKYVTPDNVKSDGKKSKSKKSKSPAGSLGEIHAMIKAASNLTAARSNGTSDPFVKGYLLPDRGKTGKQKTPVVKNSVNPSWNHVLVFDSVDPMELADRSLELTVWDHETLGTNEFLGGARLNLGHGVIKGAQVDWMDARGQESIAWQKVMEQPNNWVEAKLPLRASMGKSSSKK